MIRSSDPDLVEVVDQTAAGGPVSWVEAPAHHDPLPPSTGLTLEEWRRTFGGDPVAAPGVAACGEVAGPAAGHLPAPDVPGGQGRIPGHRPTSP